MIGDLHKRGVRVMLTGANPRVAEKLERAGIGELVGKENCFSDFADAIRLCHRLAESDPRHTHGRRVRLDDTAEAILAASRTHFATPPDTAPDNGKP